MLQADQMSKSSVIFMLGKLSMRKKIKKGGNVLPKIFTSAENNKNAIKSTQSTKSTLKW